MTNIGYLRSGTRQVLAIEWLACVAIIALASIAPRSAAAYPGDLAQVKDFKQVRTGLPATSGGTAGGAYCGPTSAADVLQWMHDNGYPDVGIDDPDPEVCTPLAGNDITTFIDDLGDLLGTDPDAGTQSQEMVDGLQAYLDDNYDGRFTVYFQGRSAECGACKTLGHNFDYITLQMNLGHLVLANIGWYAADGTRCGGHWIALRGYDMDDWPDFYTARYTDPARNCLTADTKKITYEELSLEDEDGVIRSQWASNWNWPRGAGTGTGCNVDRNGVQDNVLVIGGVKLFTRPGFASLITGYNLASGQSSSNNGDGNAPPNSLAPHPHAQFVYHCRPAANVIYKTDLITGQVTPFSVNAVLDTPRRLCFASDGTLYLYQGPVGAFSVLAIDSNGQPIGQTSHPTLAAVAYHEKTDRIWLWSGSTHQVQAFTKTLAPDGPAVNLPATPSFVAPGYAAVAPTGDVLYYNHNGSNSIFRYDLAAQMALGPITNTLLIDPEEMVVDNRGHLYVASAAAGPVLEFDTDGTLVPNSRAANLVATGKLAMMRGSRRPLVENYTGGNTNADPPSEPTSSTQPPPAGWGVRLAPPIPNPFNPSTRLVYSLPAEMRVRLTIYDVTGRTVRTLVDDLRSTGEHAVQWDGRDDAGRASASGLYTARLATDNGTSVQKLVLLR